MQIGGFKREVDWPRMGPTLVIASSLILAIRTAKWAGTLGGETSSMEWQAEVEASIAMAHRILAHLVAKSPFLFPHKEVPWYQAEEDETPR